MSPRTPTSSRIVLGIDPGIARLGFGLVRASGNSLALLDYGVVETSKHDSTGDRLRHLHTSILKLITAHQPTIMVLEQLFFSKNVSTGIVVGEARGVALLAAAEHLMDVVEVSPSTVKLSVTGYGKADKHQMQRMMQILFHLKAAPSPDDAADAIALAVCGSAPRLS